MKRYGFDCGKHFQTQLFCSNILYTLSACFRTNVHGTLFICGKCLQELLLCKQLVSRQRRSKSGEDSAWMYLHNANPVFGLIDRSVANRGQTLNSVDRYRQASGD